MGCVVCPNCGLDLERFEPQQIGDLSLEAHEIRWKGLCVPLRPSGRMIVSAIVRAAGVPVSKRALAEVLDTDSEDPDNTVAVQVCHVIRSFRQIDPSFDSIKNVRSVGLRWAA